MIGDLGRTKPREYLKLRFKISSWVSRVDINRKRCRFPEKLGTQAIINIYHKYSENQEAVEMEDAVKAIIFVYDVITKQIV